MRTPWRRFLDATGVTLLMLLSYETAVWVQLLRYMYAQTAGGGNGGGNGGGTGGPILPHN